MDFNKLIWSWAREADKSALPTINRGLHGVNVIL